MSLRTRVGQALSYKKRLMKVGVHPDHLHKNSTAIGPRRKALADRLRAKRKEVGPAKARKSLTDNAHFDRSKVRQYNGKI